METLAIVLAILCLAAWTDGTEGSDAAGALLFLGALSMAIYVSVAA